MARISQGLYYTIASNLVTLARYPVAVDGTEHVQPCITDGNCVQ